MTIQENFEKLIQNPASIYNFDTSYILKHKKLLLNYIVKAIKNGEVNKFKTINTLLGYDGFKRLIEDREEFRIALALLSNNKRNTAKSAELYFEQFNVNPLEVKHYKDGIYTRRVSFLNEAINSINQPLLEYLLKEKEKISYLPQINTPLFDHPEILSFCIKNNFQFSEYFFQYKPENSKNHCSRSLTKIKKVIKSLYHMDDYFNDKEDHNNCHLYQAYKKMLCKMLEYYVTTTGGNDFLLKNITPLIVKNKINASNFISFVCNPSIIKDKNISLLKKCGFILNKESTFSTLFEFTLEQNHEERKSFYNCFDERETEFIANELTKIEYQKKLIGEEDVEYMLYLQKKFNIKFETAKVYSNSLHIELIKKKIHSNLKFWNDAIKSQEIAIPEYLYAYNLYLHEYTDSLKSSKHNFKDSFKPEILLDAMKYISQFYYPSYPDCINRFFFNIEEKMGLSSVDIRDVYNAIFINYIPLEFQNMYNIYNEQSILKSLIKNNANEPRDKKRL